MKLPPFSFVDIKDASHIVGDNMLDKTEPMSDILARANRDQLLSEREKTHGPFHVTAWIAQNLKRFIRRVDGRYNQPICDVQAEALDNINTKIARILAGDAKCAEHWKDIAGYAKLGEEACD